MKKFMMLCLLSIGLVTMAAAQGNTRKSEWQTDKFGYTFGSTISVVPIKLSGLMDKSMSGSEYMGGREVPDEPDYSIVDTLSMLGGITLNAGVNIPLYRATNWSTGAKFSAAIGYHENLMAAEGVKGIIYDFPQFIYYRNYKTRFDYTLLVGYKYTKAPLSYHLALAGVEFAIQEKLNLRLHGSLNSYKYYMQFTDGRTKPAITYRDFGFTLIAYY